MVHAAHHRPPKSGSGSTGWRCRPDGGASLCATSCSLTRMPAHSQPIWARNECWRNYVAFTTGQACGRTSMPGADNVKDVPLAGGLQIDLMATFARSLPVHRWTLSPSTSCPAYMPPRMATNTSLLPLTTSQNGSRQYPCATQRHTRACAHFIVPFSVDLGYLANYTETREQL